MGLKYRQNKEELEELKKESKILEYLLAQPERVFTKTELMALTGYNERKVRLEMERIANFYPIRATAGRKGYSLIWFDDKFTQDEILKIYNDATNQVREIENRINCLKARLKPLIALMKVASYKLESLK